METKQAIASYAMHTFNNHNFCPANKLELLYPIRGDSEEKQENCSNSIIEQS